MTRDYAEELRLWDYAPPFQRYSMLDAEASDFTDPDNGFLALVDDAGGLVGFRSYGPDGQVPGGTYDHSALDMGGGLRPDLTGRGLGGYAIQIGVDYGWATFDVQVLRVTVWAENERALKVLRSIGFRPTHRFLATTNRDEYVVLTVRRT